MTAFDNDVQTVFISGVLNLAVFYGLIKMCKLFIRVVWLFLTF